MMNVYEVLGISLLAFLVGMAFLWIILVRRTEKKIADLEIQNYDFAQERGQLIERSSRVSELLAVIEQAKNEKDLFVQEVARNKEEIASTKAELKAERDLCASLGDRLRKAEDDLSGLHAAMSRLSSEKASLESRFDSEVRQSEEKIKLLQDAKDQLSSSFELLANKILEEKAKKFTDQNAENLGALLNPLRERIAEFQTKVDTAYHSESKERVALGEQVRQLVQLNQSLSQDAKNLTSALTGSSKAQGTWGELVLERILEASDLRKGEEYFVQTSYMNESGGQARPDITINLPENRHLVIDSKVSLSAYKDFVSSESDEESKNDALRRHVDSIRVHMKSLSAKNYQDLYQLKTLDFVLMFVPTESAFMAAITHDRNLFMDGWNKNVLLVSPSTLLFVLRTVAHLWRQEAQNKNAQEIAKRGGELYDSLCGFLKDLEDVGNRLNQAQESFKDAKNKLSSNRGNVIRRAEMLRDLGVKPNKRIPASFSVDTNEHADSSADEAQKLLGDVAAEDATGDDA